MKDEEILGGFYEYEFEKLKPVRDSWLFVVLDTTLFLILGLLLKKHTMPKDFYVTFMSNVSHPLYNDLNKTSDFWTKLSHHQI